MQRESTWKLIIGKRFNYDKKKVHAALSCVNDFAQDSLHDTGCNTARC